MEELLVNNEWVPAARKEGDQLIVSIRGEIDLHNSGELPLTLLDLILRQRPRKLVLNLALVPYMDSSAIAVLVESLQKLRKTGGQVCLTNLQPRVKSLLDIAHLASIFIIAASEEEALSK